MLDPSIPDLNLIHDNLLLLSSYGAFAGLKVKRWLALGEWSPLVASMPLVFIAILAIWLTDLNRILLDLEAGGLCQRNVLQEIWGLRAWVLFYREGIDRVLIAQLVSP